MNLPIEEMRRLIQHSVVLTDKLNANTLSRHGLRTWISQVSRIVDGVCDTFDRFHFADHYLANNDSLVLIPRQQTYSYRR